MTVPRRVFLAALPTALAGCLERSSSDDETSATDDETGTEPTTETDGTTDCEPMDPRVYLRGKFVSESDRPADEYVYSVDDDRFDGVELFEALFEAAKAMPDDQRPDKTVSTLRDANLTGVTPDDDRAVAAEKAYNADPVPPTRGLYVEVDRFQLRVTLHEEQDEAERC